MRIVEQTILGLAALIVVFFVIGEARFPMLVLAFIAPVVSGGMNLVWFGLIAGLVLGGLKWSKPGLVLAPVVFFAGWAGAAVVSQWRLQQSIDPKVWERPLAPEAGTQRTLIVKAFASVGVQIIADGHVDRLVRIEVENTHQRMTSIEETSVAHGEACSAEEKQASPELRRAGRADECFKLRYLSEIPDGLVVEQFYRIRIANNGVGCCNETQARLRSGGREQLLFSWYQGQASVLSYFPVFGFFPQAKRLWEGGMGIAHPVRYGLDDIAPNTMVSAIYGVTPAYTHGGGFPKRPALSAAETLDHVVTFARQLNVDPGRVGELLVAARDKGLVDERSIDVAVSLIGRDSEGRSAVTNLAKGLTAEQTTSLFEKMMTRLGTPNICADCTAAKRVHSEVLREWKLKERLPNAAAAHERAIRTFIDRHDLAKWQYEWLLSVIASLGPTTYPESDNYMKGAVLQLLFVDNTPAYSDKAIAYLRGSGSRPTHEGAKLAAKFDLVSDDDLKEYIYFIWSHELDKLPELHVSRRTYEVAVKACARIARISDPVIRAQKFGVGCPVPTPKSWS